MSTSSTQSKLLKRATPNFDDSSRDGEQLSARAQQQIDRDDGDTEFLEQMYAGALLQLRALYKKFKRRDLCCRHCGHRI